MKCAERHLTDKASVFYHNSHLHLDQGDAPLFIEGIVFDHHSDDNNEAIFHHQATMLPTLPHPKYTLSQQLAEEIDQPSADMKCPSSEQREEERCAAASFYGEQPYQVRHSATANTPPRTQPHHTHIVLSTKTSMRSNPALTNLKFLSNGREMVHHNPYAVHHPYTVMVYFDTQNPLPLPTLEAEEAESESRTAVVVVTDPTSTMTTTTCDIALSSCGAYPAKGSPFTGSPTHSIGSDDGGLSDPETSNAVHQLAAPPLTLPPASMTPPNLLPLQQHRHVGALNELTSGIHRKFFGLPSSVALKRIPYFRFPTTFPSHVVFGKECTHALRHMTRMKIGGVCCEMELVVMANVIYVATGITVAGVDMFTKHKGCCSVWLRTPEEAKKVQQALHQRMWMGPVELTYGVLCPSAASAQYFSTMLHEATKGKGPLHFPTHLTTVVPWQVLPPSKRT